MITKKDIARKEKEILRSAKRDTFIDTHLGRNCHLHERHVHPDTVDHIDRVLDDTAEKPTLNSSSFESEDQMKKLVAKTLLRPENRSDLAAWLLSDTRRELSLTYIDQKEPTGRGISMNPKTKQIAEYETHEMTVRLAKEPNNPDGFVIVTAFPQINENAIPTKRDILPDIKQTKAYQKGNPVDKTYYEIIGHPNFDPDKIGINIRGSKDDRHTIYLSYIDEKDPAYTHEMALNPKKTLFSTHLTADHNRKPIKTDFIKKNNYGNQISRFHDPKGMQDVYAQMPYFGAIAEYGFKILDKNVKEDKNYLRDLIRSQKAYKKDKEINKNNRPAQRPKPDNKRKSNTRSTEDLKLQVPNKNDQDFSYGG